MTLDAQSAAFLRLHPQQVPRYCSRDGMALMDRRTTIRNGFDPYSGIERPSSEHVTKECQTKGHDVWVWADAVGLPGLGHWIKL